MHPPDGIAGLSKKNISRGSETCKIMQKSEQAMFSGFYKVQVGFFS
jgi:hypothetical protein